MRRMLLSVLVVGAAGASAFLFLGAASPGDIMLRTEDVSLARLEQVDAATWQALAQKRIYFGHQSVGFDILAGVEAIQKALPQIGLDLVAGDPAVLHGKPGLAQSTIGTNCDPASKLRDFQQKLAAAGPDGVDIAVMKFCYVDVLIGTDVDQMFAAYKDTMARLQAAMPKTRLVYCTVPLRTQRATWKERIKRVLGRGDTAENRLRAAFNAKVRAEYGGKQPVFDIAAAESTLPDGTKVDNGGVPCMAACYSTDGGHLNDIGRRAVAAEFLRVLAGLAR